MTYTQEEKWLLREKYNGVYRSEFEGDAVRLAKGEPLAYVIGSVPFLNLEIDVSLRPHTPRVETEYWTEKLIEILKKDNRPLRCLDLFAGSGCIGLAVAKNVPDVHVDLSDIKTSCIEQIEKNRIRNAILRSCVSAFVSDMFSNVHSSYDYIFANPPYIALQDIGRVARSVIEFEPHEALFGGEDGFESIRTFLSEAPHYLLRSGAIFMEFDDIQKEHIEQMLVDFGYCNIRFQKDQYDRWRFVSAHVSLAV